MKIWIFNPYEPLPFEGPGRLRYASLAEKLIEAGHEVTWWSADWSHARKVKRSFPLSSKWRVESDEWRVLPDAHEAESKEHTAGCGRTNAGTGSLNLELIPVPSYRRNISLRRIWSHWCYAKGIEQRSESYVNENGWPDMILFSVPPMEAGAVALKLGRRYGAKVVLDVMDAWPDTLQLALQRIGSEERGVRSALLEAFGACALYPYRRMMQRYCREADAICAQSKAFAAHARDYGAEGGISVFHLASKGGDGPSTGKKELRTDKPQSTLRLLYLGSMGRVYDLDTLVRAVVELVKSNHDITLDCVGDGEQRADLEKLVATHGMDEEIRFHGYLEGDELSEVMQGADVGIIPMHPSSGVVMPYKAPHYLSFGLYVVNSLPGELDGLLREYGCGESYVAGDVENLSVVLSRLSANLDVVREASEAALNLFENYFESDRIHSSMAQWLINGVRGDCVPVG